MCCAAQLVEIDFFTAENIQAVMRDVPIGIQDFKKVRDEDHYYVDKTELITQILDNRMEVYLFTRPRRFGKSMNLSMLDAFLNMEYKGNSWFDDLIISERKDLEANKNSSPVICFDFKDISTDSYESFLCGMRNKIADIFNTNCRVFGKDTSPKMKSDSKAILNKTSDEDTLCRSLKYLSDAMFEYCKMKVIVLIDEYDNPVQNAYGTQDFRKILNFMKIMLGSLLKGNPSLDFAVLTGVSQISKESIFSGLNNLYVDNVLSTESDEMFGFTNEEVRKLCADYGHPEKYEEAREWYDGYIFGDAEVYNPWSLLNYIKKGFVPAAYWAGTSGNSIISDLIAKADDEVYENLMTFGSGGSISRMIDTSIVYQGLDADVDSIYSMMVTAGYLTAVPNEYGYDLRIPNKEMFGVFASMVSNSISSKTSYNLNVFTKALLKCDTAVMEKALYGILVDSVSSRVLDSEHSYQAFLAGMLLHLEGRYQVKADFEEGEGFYDIRLERMRGSSPNIVIEIKRTSSSSKSAEKLAEEALSQIKEKDYCHGLKGDTILYGISFDKKKPVILSERCRS